MIESAGRSQRLHIHAQGGCRIEDARPIQVQREAGLVGDICDLLGIGSIQNRSAAAVVRVLQDHQACFGKVNIIRANGIADILQPHRAIRLVGQAYAEKHPPGLRCRRLHRRRYG